MVVLLYSYFLADSQLQTPHGRFNLGETMENWKTCLNSKHWDEWWGKDVDASFLVIHTHEAAQKHLVIILSEGRGVDWKIFPKEPTL